MQECVLKIPKWTKKQGFIWESEATEILLGGATRGGKTFFVKKSYILFASQIPNLQLDIFRLNWDDVIANYMEGDSSFPVMLNEWVKGGLCTLTQTTVEFWNGAKIFLAHCSDDTVMSKHQGIPRHVRTWEEATQIASHRIEWLNKWVTMDENMKAAVPDKWKGRFPKIFYPTNPLGTSAPYFRRNFVDIHPAHTIWVVGDHKRQYIPILVDDNPNEDAAATRRRFSTGDQRVADAMLNANWNALVGEFFPEWDEERHVVADFTPPYHWFRYRSMDIGWAEPCAIYYIAVSDGQPFKDENGQERWFPRGARVFYNEWYICDLEDPAKGARLSNIDIADGILERSEHDFRKVPTLTDSKPFQGTGQKTPALEFQNQGVILTQVNTGPGSRVTGWSIMRSALIGKDIQSFTAKLPMVYFCECCKYARDYIPALPRHPSEGKKEDAAEHGEATHAPDAIRYGLLGHDIIKDHVIEITDKMIKDELKSSRPTMNRILKSRGNVSIN